MKKWLPEIGIGLGYSAGGSLGFYALMNFWAMALDNHLRFPFRRPVMTVAALVALFFCLGLLCYDLERGPRVGWIRWILLRVITVVLTFLPLLFVWNALVELAGQMI